MPRDEVARAFKADQLPQPSGVAPNQPFGVKGIYLSAALLMAAAIGVWLGMHWLHPPRRILEKACTFNPPAAPETASTIFESPLKLDAHRRVRVQINSAVDNSWLHVDGDLVNDETGLVQPFSIDVEYYHGFDSDGAWTEGSRDALADLSAVPAGNYTLRLEGQWEHMQSPINMIVRVDEPGPRPLYFLLLLGGLAIVPLVTAFFHFKFEAKRWEDSDFAPIAQ